MAFPNLTTTPEEITLYVPFLSGLGLSNATLATFSNTSPTTPDTFLTLLGQDVPFFNTVVNAGTTGWVARMNVNANSSFIEFNRQLVTVLEVLSGFETGTMPATTRGRGRFRAIEQMFTKKGRISSAWTSTLSSEQWIRTPTLSSTSVTALNLTSTDISALSAKVDFLTGMTFKALTGNVELLTSINISATGINVDSLTARAGKFNTVATTALNADNASVKFDLTSDTVHVRDLFISGQCVGCPGGNNSSNSSVFDGLTAEFIEIINHHEDVPALRVTQFFDQPVAVFTDIKGHPERNFKFIASGGIDVPGSTGEAFSVALNVNGDLIAWGSNAHGQLATTTNPVITPTVMPFKFDSIDTAGTHVIGLSANGTVWAWGFNVNGELGIPANRTNTSIPTQVKTACKRVAAGNSNSAAIEFNGDLYVWGSNSNGQLGVGLDNTALADSDIPLFVDSNFVNIACGGSHMIGIKSDGSLWGWGDNTFGQIGDGTNADALTPTLIDDTRIYTHVSCGVSHSAAIDKDNNLFTWGSNGRRQLGTSSLTNSSRPQLIGKFKDVSCGFFHTVAVTPDGVLQGWGANRQNQITAPSIQDEQLPVIIDDTRVYDRCFAGKDCTLAITKGPGESTFVRGGNENHQLGINTANIVNSITSLLTGQVSSAHVALFISGTETEPGFVGVLTDAPNKELTINGDVSSNGTIFGKISSPDILFTTLSGNSATVLSSHLLTSVIDNLSANLGILSTANISGLHVNNITADSLTALNASITSITASNIAVTGISAIDIDVTSISAQSLTADTGLFTGTLTANGKVLLNSDLEVMGDINLHGTLAGTVRGTDVSLINLTSHHIFATETLGVGTSSISDITNANAVLFVSGGNTVLTDNLSVLGDMAEFQTHVNITSSLSISNPHTDTALTVSQSGGLPVAEFYYTHSPFEAKNIALFIDGYAFHGDVPVDKYRGGFVGVKTKTPNVELTVNGNISSNKDIFTETGMVKAKTVSATDFFTDVFHVPNITLPGTLLANTVSSHNLSADRAVMQELTAVKLSAILATGKISSINAYVSSLSVDEAFITNLSSTSAFSLTGDYVNLHALTAKFDFLSAHESIFDSASAIHLSATNIESVGATITDLTVTNNVVAHRFFGELVGPIVTLGNSADFISLSARQGHINDLLTEKISATDLFADSATFQSLTAKIASITATNIQTDTLSATQLTAISAFVNHISSTDTLSDNISALTVNIANTGVNTNLIVTQFSNSSLAEFKYNIGAAPTIDLQPALIITSNTALGSGFIGVRKFSPTVALDVHGEIKGDDRLTVPTISSTDLTTVNGSISHLKTIDIQSSSIDVTNDLRVGGSIFGTLIGSIRNTGLTQLNLLTANRITANFIQVETLSAHLIVTPDGNSDDWNKAYNVPVAINLVLDGGGIPVQNGARGMVEVPYDIQLTSWSLYADFSSSFKVAMFVNASDFANYPLTAPIHPEPPTLNPLTDKNSSTNMTSWTSLIPAGTVLQFGVSSESLPGGPADIQATLMTLCLKGFRA